MANKEASKASEAAAPPAAAASADKTKKKLPVKLLGVALGVVLLEAATVGLTMVAAGGPRVAKADLPVPAKEEAVERDVEVLVVKDKLPNSQSGRLFLYDLEVVAKVSEKKKEKVNELMAERKAAVTDRIRTIIASSDPKSLSEPGLETLRRQINYQLEQDLGKDLIKDLLIPKCTPFRAEF